LIGFELTVHRPLSALAKRLCPWRRATVRAQVREDLLGHQLHQDLGDDLQLVAAALLPGQGRGDAAAVASGDGYQRLHGGAVQSPLRFARETARALKPSNPATVSWNEAQAFILRLSHKDGHRRYRLPTEAGWE